MKLASILNQTEILSDILSDNPVTTETDSSESQGRSSDTARSYKTCTNIEFDYSKSMWTDGLFMEDGVQMKKWKDKIGDFWENTATFFPVKPYQPVRT